MSWVPPVVGALAVAAAFDAVSTSAKREVFGTLSRTGVVAGSEHEHERDQDGQRER